MQIADSLTWPWAPAGKTPAGGRAGEGGGNDEIGSKRNWWGVSNGRGISLAFDHEVELTIRLQLGLALCKRWMQEQRIRSGAPRASWFDRGMGLRGLQATR